MIPTSMRSDVKKQIHRSHTGMKGCLRRTRELYYWHGMNVRDLMAHFLVCATFKQNSHGYLQNSMKFQIVSGPMLALIRLS